MRQEKGKFWKWEDLEIAHSKGSGPGGQNRNKRMTAVRVVHLPTGMTVLASERRSQEQNLQAALERLDEKLRQLFFKPKKRRPTRPSISSRNKRLEFKGRQGELKSMRKKIRYTD